MSIYLHIPEIKGSVTHEHYTGWITCSSIDFPGIFNQVQLTVGQSKDRVLHYPRFEPIMILKPLDQSSVHLFEYATQRKVIPTVEIDYVASGNPDYTYAKTTLKKVIIVAYSESYTPLEPTATEMIKLAYTSIQRSYTPRLSDNTASNPIISGYDLESGEPL